jgi:nitrogen fixation protein
MPGDPRQTLTGKVFRFRNTWRLRYSSVDTEDAFGGSVTLIGGPALNKLQDGQRIRVHGMLSDGETRAEGGRCVVASFEVLQ